jgi:hypothetical protein
MAYGYYGSYGQDRMPIQNIADIILNGGKDIQRLQQMNEQRLADITASDLANQGASTQGINADTEYQRLANEQLQQVMRNRDMLRQRSIGTFNPADQSQGLNFMKDLIYGQPPQAQPQGSGLWESIKSGLGTAAKAAGNFIQKMNEGGDQTNASPMNLGGSMQSQLFAPLPQQPTQQPMQSMPLPQPTQAPQVRQAQASLPTPQMPTASQGEPIKAVNLKTGQRVISFDGGNTWQLVK